MSHKLSRLYVWLPLVPALGLYFYIAKTLDFIQDDAYITFRYVANYLNGHGLVFNIGERIEGFTNFGWTIYLLLFGSLGLDYMQVAKISGLLFGAISIGLTFLISRQIFNQKQYWFAVLPVYLLSINFAFAYWAPAGLETAAFTFLVLLSLYLFFERSWLLAAALALAVWVRPEGALVAIILISLEVIIYRRIPRYTLISSIIAFTVSIPFLVFKVFYYGSILPNPFYAKTGFDLQQLRGGLEYAGQFFYHYGFFGIGFVLAMYFYKRLSNKMKSVFLFSVVFVAYVTIIGGDVLKVHRFFMPIFGLSAILMSAILFNLFGHLKNKTVNLLIFVSGIALVWLTYKLPFDEVAYYNRAEKTFVSKMDFLANEIKRTDSTDFSMAISTIGRFGFELLGHEVIDILGLTDSTIARHSQTDIIGLKTTWKERKYNVKYILERAPDYIVFSTGAKPSAPAERALFLYPSFFNSYDPFPWPRKTDPSQAMSTPYIAFKKVKPVDTVMSQPYPLEYVEYMKTGLETYPTQNFDKALAYFDSAISVSPKPYNRYLLYEKGFALGKKGEFEASWQIMKDIIKEDSFFVMAQRDAYLYARIYEDSMSARLHEEWVQKLTPWYWDEIEKVVDFQVSQWRERELRRQSN